MLSTIIGCLAVVIGANGPSRPMPLESPLSWRSFATTGQGYLHPFGPPVAHPISRAECASWVELHGIDPALRPVLETLFETFVEEHNQLMRRHLPPYLAAAAEASDAMLVFGVTSPECLRAVADADRLFVAAVEASTKAELALIDSVVPLLPDDGVDRVPMLMARAERRKHRSFTTTSRWVHLELRPLVVAVAARASFDDSRAPLLRTTLDAYAVELTKQLGLWATSMREATREQRRRWLNHDGAGAEARSAFERPARVAARIRELHLQTIDALGSAFGDELRPEWRRVALEHLYPELYPDQHALHSFFTALSTEPSLDDAARTAIDALHRDYVAAYERTSATLERFCAQWDDAVEEGTGSEVAEGLRRALEPQLRAREQLSQDAMRRCEVLLGITLIDRVRARLGPMPPAATTPAASPR
ncbi:MAG: hypothetical protein KF724_06400 [Phycisphaeraceae bacterium]|nr:hypothetical protein [Phycisphaeraceae bacterium]